MVSTASGAILLLAAATAVYAAPSCTMDQLQSCQYKFNDALNIDEPKPWQDSNPYRSKIEALYQKPGTGGVRGVCRYFREFKECLGSCYQQTVSIPFLVMNAGVKQIEATTYLATFNSLHYLCGAGLGTYMNNVNCFVNSWYDNQQALTDSRNNFELKAYLNPSAACSLMNNVLSDFEKAFIGRCGVEARDVQFWGCEYARTGMFTAYPQCTPSCSLPVVG